MAKIDLQEIMRAEVKADCYGGEACDKISNHFEVYCEGDMSSDTTTEDIVIKLSTLPAGAVVSVKYPRCPECGMAREDVLDSVGGGVRMVVGHADKCDCGFDWNEWVKNTFS